MWWRAYTVVLCAYVASAQRIDQEPLLSPRGARVRDATAGSKADEPSCETLKAMWRFSKRQARAPEIMNEVSSYRDPLEINQWPVYTAVPRAPRFRYQFPDMPRDGPYGRVITKSPPNLVRGNLVEELFASRLPTMGARPQTRTFGRSRPQQYMVPPQKNRFQALRQELLKDKLDRMYEAEQKQQLKDLASGRRGDDYYGDNADAEARGPQPLEYGDEAHHGQPKSKQQNGRNQLAQFNRYARTFFHPYYQYIAPELLPYPY